MIHLFNMKNNQNCSLNNIKLQNFESNTYIFLCFQQDKTITINNITHEVKAGSFIVYNNDNSIYKFDSEPIRHDWMALSQDICDFLKRINIRSDTIYFSHHSILDDKRRIEVEYYRNSTYSKNILDMEIMMLFYKLQRQIPRDPIFSNANKTPFKNFDFENIWKNNSNHPELRAFEGKRVESKCWNGKITKPQKIENAIYYIENAEELAWAISNSEKSHHFKLTNDIYLNDVTRIDWRTGEIEEGYQANHWFTGEDVPIFNGTLDGDGHIVYGLYYNACEVNTSFNEWSHIGCGLIPIMGFATIKNIGIQYAYLKYYDNYSFSALVGRAHRTGTGFINNCFVDTNVTLCGYDVGGIIGGGNPNGPIKIENCYSLATLIAERYSGEIIGHSWTTNTWFVDRCFCYGQPYGAFWRFPIAQDVYSLTKDLNINKQIDNQKTSSEKNSAIFEQLLYLREKMFSSLHEKWDITRMANELHISESTLFKYYNEYFECSPITNLIQKKMDTAKHMLSDSNETIKEIAYQLGYENVTHFCRQFKTCTGTTPSEYRNKSEK